MSGGRRRAAGVGGGGRLLAGALLGLSAAVAWLVLVRAAIDLGGTARTDGGVLPWVLTAVATLGAAACLAVVFVLLERSRQSLRDRRRSTPGRHR